MNQPHWSEIIGELLIKPGKSWSNYAEDVLLISLLMIGILAGYLFAAYFIIAVL